jgi:Asp-tRNA(Asn)/Glu-tRNA(Gln) amidotransferase A subunit family amidase
MTANLQFLSAAELARMVRRKEISPVELVRAHFERIEELNPTLNAFVHLRHAEAEAEARAAESVAMRGDDRPMLGVPISIKSCIDVADLACEAGSRIRADYVAAGDATLVRRLKNAGAIILGNTNTAEMLMAYDADNVLHGRTSNPWDLTRTSGGSSGGEAAAIASGMSAAGAGSDGGGSIRVPAHFTGICGLKPTPGRIPSTGHFPAGAGPFAWMGVVGPMARTVEDLRLLLSVMAGADFADPMAADYPMSSIEAAALAKTRVGILEFAVDRSPALETQAAVRDAESALLAAGFATAPVRFAELDEARALWETFFVRIAGGMLVAGVVAGHEEELSPALRKFLQVAKNGAPQTAESVLHAQFSRDELRAKFLRQMESHRVLLAPVCAGPAFRHGDGGWDDTFLTNYLRDMSFSQWFNLLGNPAAVVPVGRSPEELPIGVQVIGRPYEEMLVLAVAEVIEKRFGWREPPMEWRDARAGSAIAGFAA